MKYRKLTADRLRELGVDLVDIDDINEEGLLYSEDDRLKILEKFKAAGVDSLILPRCNFGTEYLCARLAKDLKDFLAVCRVVKTFRNIRILQIGPRSFDFWSTMCNEGELLERFGVELSPVPLPELTAEVKKAIADGTEVQETIAYCLPNQEEYEQIIADFAARKEAALHE